MSLYEYSVALDTAEDKEEFLRLLSIMPRRSVWGSYKPCGCDYAPGRETRRCEFHGGIHTLIRYYDNPKAICLGRPLTGQGETNLTQALENIGLDYDEPVFLGEDNGGYLLRCVAADDTEAIKWILQCAGRWLVKVNDNEF